MAWTCSYAERHQTPYYIPCQDCVREILPRNVRASEVNIGDIVRTLTGPFSYAVVIQKDEYEITLFRPYAVTSDFLTAAGAIPYIGSERYDVALERLVTLISRGHRKV